MNMTKKKLTHIYNEQTSGYQWGEGSKEGQDWGMGLCIKQKSNKDLLYDTGNYSHYLVITSVEYKLQKY